MWGEQLLFIYVGNMGFRKCCFYSVVMWVAAGAVYIE
jgi:hypothetical protein